MKIGTGSVHSRLLPNIDYTMLVKKIRIPVLHILFVGFLPGFLKKWVYRMKGYKIGKHVSLSLGCVIAGKKVVIADHCKIGFFTIIRGRDIRIDRFVKIGSMSVIDTERIEIGEDARINEQVYVGGMKTPQSALIVGKRAIIMQLTYINPTLPVEIGDDTGVGGHCLLFTHGSWSSKLDGYPVTFAPIKLGNKVWLPWRVFVLPGVTIGDGSVIGANSLVASDIPANALAAGSPAKILKTNFPVKPDVQSQRDTIDQILKEFMDYLVYFGYSCAVEQEAAGFTAVLKGEKSGTLVYRHSPFTGTPPQGDGVLVLFRATAA
ncbi:MAG TPA: hypothetical protein PLU53_06365 [Bacteroidia bacterium]|nr:hypothetical protein [Bacteroidia bacterium]